jgi:hypothetical protein
MTAGEEYEELDTPAIIYNERMFVPLSFIEKVLGGYYTNRNNTITITFYSAEDYAVE